MYQEYRVGVKIQWPVGIMIRNNQNITGIIINEKEHKLSQYADDTLFFFRRNK